MDNHTTDDDVLVNTQALFFYKCKQLRVSDLTLRDSQQDHTVFSNCDDVEASHLTIRAPERSPNTDGIHVTSTRQMTISNCFIGTGKKLEYNGVSVPTCNTDRSEYQY
jgi:polygalacturonase